MKIKHFTHTDLDGVACAILSKIAFNNKDIDIIYAVNNDIDYKLIDALEERCESYDLLITDLPIKEDTAAEINIENNINNIVYIDHHKTSAFLNDQYFWSVVKLNHEAGKKACAASLYCDHLIKSDIIKNHPKIDVILQFIELVRQYDTWEWHDVYNDYEAKFLNDLFYLIDRDEFIDMVINIINTEDEFITPEIYDDLLERNQKEISQYIKTKRKQIIEINVLEDKVGVVFAERFISELGNELSKLNPHLHYIIIININSGISYRTINKDIDVSEVAKIRNGGGHTSSAGSPITEKEREMIITYLLGSHINIINKETKKDN